MPQRRGHRAAPSPERSVGERPDAVELRQGGAGGGQ